MTSTIDIWVFPNTPRCQEVAHLVGTDRRVRLLDARQFRDYVPKELEEVPGFVFTAKNGKRYAWQGEKCVQYVRLYFGQGRNMMGPMAGAPVRDIRDHHPQTLPYRPPAAAQPQPQPYQPQPYQPPVAAQPQHPQPQPGMSFGSHRFSQLMQGRVHNGTVMSLDERQMGSSAPAGNFESERARQDAQFLSRR